MKKTIIIFALLASSAALAYTGSEPLPAPVEQVNVPTEPNEFGTMEDDSAAEEFASDCGCAGSPPPPPPKCPKTGCK
jgi:hypothetical protein